MSLARHNNEKLRKAAIHIMELSGVNSSNHHTILC